MKANRELATLKALRRFFWEHGRGPSYQEMEDCTGTSAQTLHSDLQKLVAQGQVRRLDTGRNCYVPVEAIRAPGVVGYRAPDGFVVAAVYRDPATAAQVTQDVRERALCYEAARRRAGG